MRVRKLSDYGYQAQAYAREIAPTHPRDCECNSCHEIERYGAELVHAQYELDAAIERGEDAEEILRLEGAVAIAGGE